MLSLADHANLESGVAFPSIERIAERSKLSCRQVQRALRLLEASGELRRERNAGPNGVNLYRLTLGDNMSGVTICQGDISGQGGDISGQKHVRNVTRNRKEPSLEPSLEPSKKKRTARFMVWLSYDSKVSGFCFKTAWIVSTKGF